MDFGPHKNSKRMRKLFKKASEAMFNFVLTTTTNNSHHLRWLYVFFSLLFRNAGVVFDLVLSGFGLLNCQTF